MPTISHESAGSNTATTTQAGPARVVAPGEGARFALTEVDHLVWKATADTTGGAFDAFEDTIDAFAPGPPEHVHDTVDELFYVLEGELLMKLDGAQSSAAAGTFVYVPRGTSHAWVNVGTTAARMLVHFLPGGMQGFFEATSPLLRADPLDIPAIVAAAASFETRVTGPPLDRPPLAAPIP